GSGIAGIFDASPETSTRRVAEPVNGPGCVARNSIVFVPAFQPLPLAATTAALFIVVEQNCSAQGPSGAKTSVAPPLIRTEKGASRVTDRLSYNVLGINPGTLKDV